MGQKVSTADAFQLIQEELGVPKACAPVSLQEITSNANGEHGIKLQAFLCLVPKQWLLDASTSDSKCLSKINEDPPFSSAEQVAILQPSHPGHKSDWLRVKISVLKKRVEPFRLGVTENSGSSTANFFAVYDALAKGNQAMKKSLFRQKLSDLSLFLGVNKDNRDEDFDHYQEENLPSLLQQLCGVQLHLLGQPKSEKEINSHNAFSTYDYWSNLHILPIITALRSESGYFFIEPCPQSSLYDALCYNPNMFSVSSLHPMFLVYQLLQIMASYESKGISLSPSFCLKDLYIINNLWLFSSGLHLQLERLTSGNEKYNDFFVYPTLWTDSSIVHGFDHCEQALFFYTDLWVNSKLSNFDYLLILNKFAGRRPFDPHHHPVMPWITDFHCKNSGFRDLTKSKFRLKKGDSHLNAMYKADALHFHDRNILKSASPHHMTDVLSDLSFYLYFARRMPRTLLCAHVRPRWVPDEYPQTMEKLYDQAAEESIPEFFCDSSIFQSIHSDMSDLGLPSWVETPDEFVKYHRDLLESDFVSNNLHHWIDLVFGFKLIGEDAIRSKNVYLSMVSEERLVSNYGAIALFSKPHPIKSCSIERVMSTPENVNEQVDGIVQTREDSVLLDEFSSHSSTYQIVANESSTLNNDTTADASKSSSGDTSSLSNGSVREGDQELIQLSDNENFLAEMEAVESHLKFQISLGNLRSDKAGEFRFGLAIDRDKTQVLSIVKNLSPGLKLFICMAIEMFLHEDVRHRVLETNLDDRTVQNLKILKSNRKKLPRWLGNLLTNLSGVVSPDSTLSRNREVPKNVTPSSLLNPAFNLFSFPKYFPMLHKFLASLYSIDVASPSRISYQWIQGSSNLPSKQRIIEASETLAKLTEELDGEGIELLLTFLMPFFSFPETKITSLLHLLYPLGRTVGQWRSLEIFVKLIVQTYDSVDIHDSEETQIFAQSYISKLITVFGVENFIVYILPFILDGLLGDHVWNEHRLDKSTSNLKKLQRLSSFTMKQEKEESSDSSNSNVNSDRESIDSDGEDVFNVPTSKDQEILVSLEPFTTQSDMESHDDVASDLEVNVHELDLDKKERYVEEEEEVSPTSCDSDSWRLDGNRTNTADDDVKTDAGQALPDQVELQSDNNTEYGDANGQTIFTSTCTDEVDSDLAVEKNIPSQLNDTGVSPTSPDEVPCRTPTSVGRLRSISESLDDDSNDPILLSSENYLAVKEGTDSEESPFTLLLPTLDDHEEVEKHSGIVEASLNGVENIPFEDAKYETIFKRTFSEEDSSKPLPVNHLCHESVLWLIPWLGPLQTSQHIVKRLLKKLPRVFAIQQTEFSDSDESTSQNKDEIREQVIDCLIEIAQVYGEAIVMLHYVPFAINAVDSATSGKLITSHLEGHLIAAFTLLHRAMLILPTGSLMKEIEPLSDKVFQPLLRILSTLRSFHSDHHARTILSRLLVDILGVFSRKLGREYAQEALMSLLQQFFSCFDGIYLQRRSASGYAFVVRKFSMLSETPSNQDEWGKEAQLQKTQSHGGDTTVPYYDDYSIEDIIDTFSSQANVSLSNDGKHQQDSVTCQGNASISSAKDALEDSEMTEDTRMLNKGSYEDLYETFSPSLAYYSYVLFCRTLGEQYMEKTLYNSELIWQLCTNHDERLTLASCPVQLSAPEKTDLGTLSDSNVGDLTKMLGKQGRKKSQSDHALGKRVSTDTTSSVSFRSTWQHITGSWLELCEDRQRERSTESFDFHNRRLQTYAGHSAAVKDIHVPENEHYFLSASRDKTVKFWLLKNHGNGTAQLGNTGFYDKHTKPVFAVQSINSKRLAVSCDGSVHVWDPITGAAVSKFEPPKGVNVVSIRTLPSPHSAVVLATSEGLARLYDVRQKMPFGEWKTSPLSMGGNVRSMAVPYDSSWLAIGFSTGVVSVLDMRTGIMRNQWRAHDSEVIQVLPCNNHNFLSVSVAPHFKMWADDGTLDFKLRAPQDTILSAALCEGKCIWGSSNKIGVYHSLVNGGESIARKISTDIFKGNISKVAVLPINQLFLVGNENGNVVLFE